MDPKEIDRVEAIVFSMTPGERQKPTILNTSRKRRIARGSGTSVADVNALLKQFSQTQSMVRQMVTGPPGQKGPGHGQPGRAQSAKSKKHHKKKHAR
jgi:signal recognition particle subunit SRP54